MIVISWMIVDPFFNRIRMRLGLPAEQSEGLNNKRHTISLAISFLALMVPELIHWLVDDKPVQTLEEFVSSAVSPAVITYFWILGARQGPPVAFFVSAFVGWLSPLLIGWLDTIDGHLFTMNLFVSIGPLFLGCLGGLAIDRPGKSGPIQSVAGIFCALAIILVIFTLAGGPSRDPNFVQYVQSVALGFGWIIGLCLSPRANYLLDTRRSYWTRVEPGKLETAISFPHSRVV
jgi:hypothetical protein